MRCDFNNDGKINIFDLLAFLNHLSGNKLIVDAEKDYIHPIPDTLFVVDSIYVNFLAQSNFEGTWQLVSLTELTPLSTNPLGNYSTWVGTQPSTYGSATFNKDSTFSLTYTTPAGSVTAQGNYGLEDGGKKLVLFVNYDEKNRFLFYPSMVGYLMTWTEWGDYDIGGVRTSQYYDTYVWVQKSTSINFNYLAGTNSRVVGSEKSKARLGN
jgi:hypothetical protein